MLAAALMLAGLAASNPLDVSAHRAEIEKWREKRMASLRREDGWLTLVGLVWLEPGENTLGSGRSNRIVLPEGAAPERMGSIVLSGGNATARILPGVDVTHQDRSVTSIELQSDADGEPTVLKHGRISFYLIKRGERLGVRVKDSRNPALLSFHGIEAFPVDLRWRFEARFQSYEAGKKIRVPNILGTVGEETSPGAVVFDLGGRTYRLDAVKESGTEDLFLIFGDQTNGEQTYGGGRFLYAAPPDKQGRVVVDFNKAYNPPCVFTPYATCPLPPTQNRLPIRVEAGEKRYGNH